MPDDEGAAAEKRKRELKGDIDHKFVQFDDFPRAFGEGVEGLYVQPRGIIIGGLTADNYVGPAMLDAANRLETVSSPYGIGSGGVRVASGTFTKNATGTTGTVIVTAGTDDVIYFMYGVVQIGAAHAGAASPLEAGIAVANSGGGSIRQRFLYDATADVNEVFDFPGLGEVPAAGGAKTSGVYNPLQCMIPNLNHFTEDGPGSAAGVPRFVIEYETMANTEDFFYELYFFSVNDTAVVSSAGAGAIA